MRLSIEAREMQQTFQCYRCGAQNYVGQPYCWNCQSPFQWNCPNCRAPVKNTMASCPYCHILLSWPSNQKQQPSDYKSQSSYLDDAYDLYFKSVSNNAENKFELALWSAWGNAAAFLDGGLSAVSEFNISSDSLDKAKCLINLLIQPMISIWFNNWEKQKPHSSREMLEARKTAFENVQTFLGMSSSTVLSIHLILDVELTNFLNNINKSSAYYTAIFHQRYRELMKGERIVEWNKLKVPIGAWEDFFCLCNKSRYENLSEESSVVTFSTITDAGVRMFTEFKNIYGQT